MRKDPVEQTLAAAAGNPSSPLPPAPAPVEQDTATASGLSAGKLAGLSSLMAATLAACGGGDSGTDPLSPTPGVPSAPGTPGQPFPSPSAPSPNPTPLDPNAPAPSPAAPAVEPITDAEAARFLLQAQLSASPAEIKAVQEKGYSAWLDEQMSTPISTSGWDMVAGYRIPYNNRFDGSPADFMAWRQLITAPDGLRKRLALAWSEILVVSTSGIGGESPAFAMAAYWDLLNQHVFGNYRQLLQAITLNPAMGMYLNTRGNQKEDTATGRRPDENYAREVLQLFSIGLYQLNQDGTLAGATPTETYGMSDVSELARVFTGYDLDETNHIKGVRPERYRSPMALNPAKHSNLPATFLGQTVPGGSDGAARLSRALDIIASHPNVGPFIGRQLIQRLVTSNPSAAYVGRVAAAFNDNGQGVRGDLRAVTRAVLLDPEARESPSLKDASWGKLREPIVRFVQWARTFGATSADGRWVIWDQSNASTGLGQSPLRSPSVFNFFRPGYVPPGTRMALTGQTVPEFQLLNETTVAGYINFMGDRISWGMGSTESRIKSVYPNERPLALDPPTLVKRLNLLLTANQLPARTVALIQNAVADVGPTTSDWAQQLRVWTAVLLVMASPEYLIQK